MVDRTAPPASESQQQNGSPVAADAAATAAAASNLPPNTQGTADTASGGYGGSQQWDWNRANESDASSRSSRMNMKLVGGLGGALLLAAGIGGFIIARRRRHSSRRDQALRAARDSASLAASAVGSIRESDMGRRVIGAMPDRDVMESAVEQNAKRASQAAGHLAKRVRQQIGR